MKKVLSFIILNSCLLIFAQNLNLRNTISEDFEFPQKLQEDDIAIVREISGGWTAYDYLTYYFIDNNGNINSYSEERPKKYLKNNELKTTLKNLELTEDKKSKIKQLINSMQLSEFLKFNQEDFKLKVDENLAPPCIISDHSTIQLTFIQNNKQNSYRYYAPKYYYEKCPQISINKKMLKKYIDIIDLL